MALVAGAGSKAGVAVARACWAGAPDPQAKSARAMALHPPGRIGRPEEVAMRAALLSDEAPFIEAEAIVIDGRRSALYHG